MHMNASFMRGKMVSFDHLTLENHSTIKMTQGDYRIIAHEKRLQRSQKIPTAWTLDEEKRQGTFNPLDLPITCGILSDTEIDITSKYDATSLLMGIKIGTWSVEQVTTAFCKRAAIAHQMVNFIELSLK